MVHLNSPSHLIYTLCIHTYTFTYLPLLCGTYSHHIDNIVHRVLQLYHPQLHPRYPNNGRQPTQAVPNYMNSA